MPYVQHQNELPYRGEIFLGAVTLALIAGFINTVMLDIYHLPVSHMSGAISKLGIDLGENKFDELLSIGILVFFFVCGAAISGLVIGSNNLQPGKNYGLTLSLEGLLLIAASLLADTGSFYSVNLAAMACGMQNAMASSYYGLIIRTTHMTGILTDLGFMIGNVLRKDHQIIPWKFIMLLLILCGFFLGGLFAVFAKSWFEMQTLLIIGSLLLVVGIFYFLKHRN